MFITVITDCKSQNDLGRQTTRLSNLFNCPINTVGVTPSLQSDTAALETAGTLVDILDASDGGKGIVIANVAPRGELHKWKNGTPFCYFWYKDTLVISTYEGYTLSLVKKLHVTSVVHLVDIEVFLKDFGDGLLFDSSRKQRIINTQFRSFDFVPYLAKVLFGGSTVSSTEIKIEEVPSFPECIWYIDDFGNCKTTLLREQLCILTDSNVQTKFGTLRFYERLKDVPIGEAALYIGSSGIDDVRFVEFCVQRQSAQAKYRLNVGDTII